MTFEEKYAAQGRKLDELKAKLDSAVDARKVAHEKNREQIAADLEALDAKVYDFYAAADAKMDAGLDEAKAKVDADAAKVKAAFTLDQATAENIASAPTGINEIQKQTAGDVAAAAENVRLMSERRDATINAAKLRTEMKVNAAKEKIAAHKEAIDKAAQEELIVDLLDYAEGCYEMACAWALEAEAAMMEAAGEINDYTEKYGEQA